MSEHTRQSLDTRHATGIIDGMTTKLISHVRGQASGRHSPRDP